MNSKEFSLTIESIVKEKKISHMDAIVWYCDENNLDTGQISSLVSKSLKEKIQVEATRLNMLKMPKCGVLPIQCMYGGFDVYKTYLGVKLHFTSDTYDYYKYGGKVNTKLDTFTKRKDRYFFHKLSTRYAEADILDFFVANFLSDSKRWIGNLLANDGRDVYLDYKKRKEAFAYHFKQDCGSIVSDFRRKSISFDDGFIPVNGQHPRVLR